MERLTRALPSGGIWNIAGLILALILFFTSLDLLGEGFDLLGDDAAEALLASTANPITGFFYGYFSYHTCAKFLNDDFFNSCTCCCRNN